MSKKNIDYSNTIIYKICCRDETITDVYVGHTTNFIQRKYLHKNACNDFNNKLKVYNVIRSNGGWENWDMVEIEKYNCKDATEARIKEQEHYNNLKASLNSCPPYVDKTKYFCSICNVQCNGPKQYNLHINAIKHINNESSDEIEKSQKNIQKYSCDICNYFTSNIKDFNKHVLTKKHVHKTSSTIRGTLSTKDIKSHTCCNCKQEYQDRSGLWRHKKTCLYPILSNTQKPDDVNAKKSGQENWDHDEKFIKQVILLMLQQNNKVQDALIEMSKQILKSNTNNINNTGNNN